MEVIHIMVIYLALMGKKENRMFFWKYVTIYISILQFVLFKTPPLCEGSWCKDIGNFL